MKIKFISGILGSSLLVILVVLGFKNLPSDLNSQKASAISSTKIENIYNISPSKELPGMYNFEYAFDKATVNLKKNEALFDLPVIPFDDELARKILEKEYGLTNADFGSIRDAWNYPVKPNAFMKGYEKADGKKQSFLYNLKTNKALAYDESPEPGVYNCRANTSVTGYFKAYFEDVVLDNDLGYDDPTYGEGRRMEACQVLQDIGEMLMLDETTVTPDIIFMRSDTFMPANVLASATSYFGYYSTILDNGSLYKHITLEQDPTPTVGNFDALIITSFLGNTQWDVDSTLNSLTYDMYSVIYHEVMHALGFRGLLPAAISQTNIPQRHGTFDSFTYKDNTLQNRFITTITNLLNVPVGAPSPWFTTNQVVYQGVKNIVGATPDEVKPIYSPTNWQQGSSLSHFDMTRAPGETFIMHPSITTNTERGIDDDEKDVLCHLGYKIEGLCEDHTPVAVDDFVELDGTNPVCVNLIQNDLNHGGSVEQLRVKNLELINVQPGDTIQYFTNTNCSDEIQTPSGANSIRFIPVDGPSVRILSYTNININTNRFSNLGLVTISSCFSEPGEYICNGDFEIGPMPEANNPQLSLSCPSDFIGWCNFRDSTDIYTRNLNFDAPWTPSGPQDTYSGYPNNRYVGGIRGGYIPNNYVGNRLYVESNQTKTVSVLSPGNYRLQWYGAYLFSTGISSVSQKIYISDNPLEPSSQWGDYIPDSTELSFDVPVILNLYDYSNIDSWQQYSLDFQIPDNGISYNYIIFDPEFISSTDSSNSNPHYYIDGVSLKNLDHPQDSESLISGNVYQDINENSTYENTEPKLPGVQVGLFQSGNSTPIQTVTTQDIPNLGKYTFNNLADGTYYVALMGENLYPQVTQPSTSTDPFPTYNHMYEVNLSGNQVVENRDFGVSLNSTTRRPLDISIQKSLIDSSLSIFDRYVTWRVSVSNAGPAIATNIIVQDTLPEGLIFSSAISSNQNNTFNSLTGEYTIPELNPGQTTVLDITTRVPNSKKVCGIKTNTVGLVSVDQNDTNTVNNYALANIKLPPCYVSSPIKTDSI